MLEFKITINDDGKDAENQARAVVAGLVGFYGPGIIPAIYEQVGSVARATGPVNVVIRDSKGVSSFTENGPGNYTVEFGKTPLAPDGYPTDEDFQRQAEASVNAVSESTGISVDRLTGNHGLDRDTAGIPWDERIHASTKTTNKDGTWTRRRNTPDETFDAVMAELKGAAPAPVATPAIPAPPAPAAEPTASEAFAAPATPAAVPTPPTPAATGDAPSFVDLMKKITTLQGAGKLTKPDLDGYLQSCGVEGVGKLATASADARSNVGAILDGLV